MDPIVEIVDMTLEEADAAVREALAAEGFGVLTEIDVAATLKTKLGVERSPLVILGACNPGLAHRALEFDVDFSLLMPCNVVLMPSGEGTRIAAMNPRDMIETEELADLADEGERRLRAALAHVAELAET